MNETTSKFDGLAPPAEGESKLASPAGFELLEEVGRGGMGVVYRANDLALGREVAVKILQQHFDPASRAAVRFLQESRVTAQLQHPGVPSVYQVGTLDGGRPFLAMKLIEGRTLDTLIQTAEAIDVPAVFEAIAHAVGYAHARGVIHRDLKPANIMVGAFGEVQVMDWGLSKVLAAGVGRRRQQTNPGSTADHQESPPPDTSDDGFTQAGSVLGTPSYMAPEQAAGEIDRIGPRSDVFGLGAILCSMLTIKPPFEGDSAESVRLNAVRGKTEAALARLDASGADLDLIALCKRCLAFEPGDRPADGNEVASQVEQLRRAADDRAKKAEQDRLAADVRRRAIQKGAIVAATVLLLGIVGTSIGFYRAENARKLAVAKEKEADSVINFLQSRVLAAARPKTVPGGLGRDVTLRDAITASLAHLETGFKDQPLVEARLRKTLGTTFTYLGRYDVALQQYQRVLEIITEIRGKDHPESLIAASGLGNTYVRLGRYDEGVRLHSKLLDDNQRILGPDHPDTLESMENLAYAYTEIGRRAQALDLQEKVWSGRKRTLAPDDAKTLSAGSNLAVNYSALGRNSDALNLQEALRPGFERTFDPEHPDFLSFKGNLANSYFEAGRFEEALKLQREVLESQQRILGADHPDAPRRNWEIARTLSALNRSAEAIPFVDACVAMADKVVHPLMLTEVLTIRLRHFEKAGTPKDCRTTAEMWEKLNRSDPDSLYNAACFRAIAAVSFAKANQPAEAETEADRAKEWLARAIAAGFDDLNNLKTDKDLDGLRSRGDFNKLVESLTSKKRISETKK